jgi:outer membrane lipoprotein SlyB
MLHKTSSILVLTLLFALGGCASSMSGKAYERSSARTVQEVQMGTVTHVREVQIEGTKTNIGASVGAVIGGTAGGNSRSPVRSTIGGAAGAVVGGMIGAAAEEGMTRQKGIEITVKLDAGRMIAITQAADEDFKVGDQVRILTGGGVTRVAH